MKADFGGDPMVMLNMRWWLERALKANGGTLTGGGIGCGQADVDVEIDGHRFNVSIRPLPSSK